MDLAKEMIINNRNVMTVTIQDIDNFNQCLSDKIKTDYWGVFTSLSNALRSFMASNLDSPSNKEFYLCIDL